jgi:hypothetical protein
MIIRKITDYSEEGMKTAYHILSDERKEGWEMEREELLQLIDLARKALGTTLSVTVDIDKEKLISELKERLSQDMEAEDENEECPDFIEPSEADSSSIAFGVDTDFEPLIVNAETPEEVTESSENPTISDEKSQETPQKVQKTEPRDFSKYTDMALKGIIPKMIIASMAQDMEISTATATTYWYSKVKPLAAAKDEQDRLRAIEAEKKQLEKSLEKKIQVIPASESEDMYKRKTWTPEQRERIRKAAGVIIDRRSKDEFEDQ